MYHKLLAAATGTSLLLTAVPAFASETHVDLTTDVSVTSESKVQVPTHLGPTSVRALKRMKRGSDDTSPDGRQKCDEAVSATECATQLPGKSQVNTDTSLKASLSVMTPETREAHIMDRIAKTAKRLVNHLARLTQRLCSVTSGTDVVSAQECVQKMGLDLKTRISVMIDSAFGLDS